MERNKTRNNLKGSRLKWNKAENNLKESHLERSNDRDSLKVSQLKEVKNTKLPHLERGLVSTYMILIWKESKKATT